MSEVWTDSDDAAIDLKRLIAYRDRNLHRVGAPVGELSEAEAAEITRRLRLGFEGARRLLQDDAGDWWPYIETVHSNVPGLRYDRSSMRQPQPVLNEGDHIVIDVVAVNPLGPADGLRYNAVLGGITALGSSQWQESGHFEFDVPRARDGDIALLVYDSSDASLFSLDDILNLRFRIRPARH